MRAPDGSPDLARLLADHPSLDSVVAQAGDHRIQIVLGEVREDVDGRLSLHQSDYRAGAEYFYPASTIKMFAAVAALEYLDELRDETGLAIDVDTPLAYHPLDPDGPIDDSDPDNIAGGTITVRQQIRELFLVSDNTAFNRLYDLVGQERLNDTIRRAGIASARIVHRLSVARTADENLRAPRIDFRGQDFTFSLPQRRSEPQPEGTLSAGMQIGEAYLAFGERVEEPLDFVPKNRIDLADLQRGLCMVVRPDVDCGGAGFDLRDQDRELLLEAMSRFPRQSTNPVYDPDKYPDHYVKFVLPGLERLLPKDEFTVYNKVGQAYGFTTENAWIVDRRSGEGFFLAATIYTNANATLNDDDYEYAEIAEPFMADLAEAVARHFWPR